MYFSTLATLVVAAASSVSGLVIPRATPPAGWATDYLEPYDTYHTRYLAVGCLGKQGTAFFDQCCHPLLATETLEKNRAPQCNPASASASSSVAAAKATTSAVDSNTDDGDDDEDCEEDGDDDDVSSTFAAVTPTPVVTTTHAAATPTEPATTTKAAVVAPQTTAAPAPTTTKAQTTAAPAPPTTKAQTTAQAATTQASSSSSQVQTGGFATFFYQNGVAGACGTVHQDTDMIAAIDADRYGNTGERSALCGKQVQITNTKNGNSVTVTIADACPTCDNSNSIDLSQGAFEKIAPLSDGLVPITWSFV